MINKLKNIKLTKRGIYISLAVCMLVIGGIGVFSAVRNMGKIIEESDINYVDIPTGNDIINSEFFNSLNDTPTEEPTNNEKITLNFIIPTEGQVVKEFSGSELVYSDTMNDYRTHKGVDIIAEDGASVISSESGKIINVYDDPLWGTTVEIEHAGGFTSCYRNLSDVVPEGIEVGSFVISGGIIGTVGTTALIEMGENTHLHFEMCLNGESVNPLDYITFS